MGVTSKAFLKLHGCAGVRKTESATPGKPRSLWGGLIRKSQSKPVPPRLIRKSAGELGSIAKAKDALGHGSEKRGDGGGQKTADAESTKHHWIASSLLNDESSSNEEMSANFQQQGPMSKEEADHYVAQRGAALRDWQSFSLKPYQQGVQKAGTSDGAKKGWETRRGAGGGDSGTKEQKYDVVGAMMQFEEGSLDRDETLNLFQHLVDTGMAWKLQGSYGRAADALLKQGLIRLPQERRSDAYGNTVPSQSDVDSGNEVAQASRVGRPRK